MTADEALWAATAAAPARCGATTSAGSRPAPARTRCPRRAVLHHLVYRPGVPLVGAAMIAGQIVMLELDER